MARIKIFDKTTQSWVYADKSFGQNGDSITITNIAESSEDGGNNIITFSDGSKINIKNGNTGNGIKSAILNADYTLTLTFDNGTTYKTPSIRGANGVGIASIEQTTTSTADGGNNVFTITLTDGTSKTFTVKNGSKGTAGTSVTVSNVSESSADGGNNVVTFSDGKKLTIKNGSKGSAGTSATHSWNGTTLSVTSASGTSSANLKGDKGDSVTVSKVTESTAENGSNVVTFSDGKSLSIKNGKTPVRGTDYWTEADQESIVQQVLAVMGMHIIGSVNENNDIVFSGDLDAGTYTLKFEDADGNVQEVGTIEIVKKDDDEPAYTNMIPKSINADGTPYVGNNGEDGYKTNVRLNSTGVESTSSSTGFNVTGFIPVKHKDVVYFKNVKYNPTEEVSGNYIAVYDSTFKVIASIKSGIMGTSYYLFDPITVDESGYITSITMCDGSQDYAYLRVSATGLNADSIITVNEPIV